MAEGINNKVVLIIGGGGGIGSQAAILLASRGATAVMADIDLGKAVRVAEAIADAGGLAAAYAVDATDRHQVGQLVRTVVQRYGRLDVLINSAGVMFIRPMSEADTAEWEATIDLNIKGTLWPVAAALPVFQAQGEGHVINLGSVHGLKVFSPGGAVHSGSKFAIGAISEGLRAEMAPLGVRVTTVTPGAVDTGIQAKTTGAESARILEIYRRAISPSVVARAIAFAIEQPPEVSINEIVVRPTAQVI
jgi:NADP-dependent 3-hydroxy acid dehydrogenase YdfG